MKRVAFLLLAVAVPATARESLGVFDSWGAFTDPSPARCYAIAQPLPKGSLQTGSIQKGPPQKTPLQKGLSQKEPTQPSGVAGLRPFASVSTWPGPNGVGGVRNQLHIRLSREREAQSRVTLSVGERRFELVAGNADAWAPDARTDAAIVTAMRSSRSMSVETLGRNGAPFADVYALRGAATAIDAAALGCVGR